MGAMAILDLHNTALPSDFVLQGDVCIVGSGPAGCVIAREFSRSSLQVILLESGSFARDPAADELNEIDNIGRPRAHDQWSVRNRIVGGSSHTWGGRCAAFDEIDFQQRDWVPFSGWPIARNDLLPYLDRSAGYLGLAVGSGFSDARFWSLAKLRAPVPELDARLLEPFFWQFSRGLNESYPFEYVRFGRDLVSQISPQTTLVTGATVQRVLTTPEQSNCRGVEFVTPDGHPGTVVASRVILCAGGIENPRILLNSGSAGLGNRHDQVGRYLMDHLRGPIGQFDVTTSHILQRRFGRYNLKRHFFRAGMRLSPVVQRHEGLLNCAAWLGEGLATDDPWDALRRVLSRRSRRYGDVSTVVRNSRFIARGAFEYFSRHNGLPRKLEHLTLDCMSEQVPSPISRVTLSDQRDRFGMRLPRIDWRSSPNEARTMHRLAELVVSEFKRMDLPKPDLAEWVRDRAEIPASFLDVAHPTGTTRISLDPTQGVVDANCEVHDTPNLFVAGSSVFPTGGHCNPTQMIVAMAIRLADHVRIGLGEKVIIEDAVDAR